MESLALSFAEDSILQSPIILWVAIGAIWIFVLILPQRREQKRRNEMQQNVKKGDQILLQCGAMGRVWATKENTVVVEFDGCKIPFLRNTIVKTIDDSEGASQKK